LAAINSNKCSKTVKLINGKVNWFAALRLYGTCVQFAIPPANGKQARVEKEIYQTLLFNRKPDTWIKCTPLTILRQPLFPFSRRNTLIALLHSSRKYLHIKSTEQCLASSELRTIDPPPPLPLASVSFPRTKGGGVRTHSPGGEGVGGKYFGRRQTLDWPLTV
jgi:hypothetical protein